MFSMSRMKSLMSPTFSLLSPNIARSKPFPLYFGPFSSLVCNSRSLIKNPNFLFLRPFLLYSKSFVSSDSIRCYTLQSEGSQQPSSSGEIHVIVGPMFAGKTTALLRRIQSERNNGSFQVDYLKSSFLLDKTLKGLCFSGRLREAVKLLFFTGSAVEWQTYSLMLQECIHRKEFELGRRIHAQMVVAGFSPNEYLKTKLLILYAKAGRLETACIFFNNLLRKSLIQWNAMIAGFVQSGLEEVGLSLYYEMRSSGLIPDHFTFSTVFRACAAIALLEQGKRAHGVMIKCQIGQNVVVNSAVMDMYFKCSCPSDGHKVFNKFSSRNVITWTALICGYGQNGKVIEVLELFERMSDEGFMPNYVTFLAVLSACSHGGLVSEGWKYFSSMERVYGIRPKGKHYAAMVDLLGRAGRLHEAYEFVKNSPFMEHPVVWGALLGACRVHENVELVKFSARKFFELEPENAGKYVVLSNAYANSGLWEDVAEVRGLMRDSRMRKDPGYSRIEVKNEVHFFFMHDNTHEQAEKTYEMLDELTYTLKDACFAPCISI